MWKSDDQERFQKIHDFFMEIWCQNERPWRVKKRFSCDACCILRRFAGSWNLMKNGHQKVIQHAERHRRTPRLTAISGKAMRAWVAGFDWGRFNASRRLILPILVFEKPKITEQAIVTWTGFQEQGRKSSIKFFQRFGNQKRAKGSRNGTNNLFARHLNKIVFGRNKYICKLFVQNKNTKR